MNRRDFLGVVATASAAAGNPASALQVGSYVPNSSVLKLDSKQLAVKPGQVTLRDSLFKQRYLLHTRYLKQVPAEDILMPFLQSAGLPYTGKELNGDCADHCQSGPHQWRGLQNTYWMLGAATTARWGNDEELRKRLVYITHELARTRQPDGFLLASPVGYKGWEDHFSLTSRARSMMRALSEIYEATGDPLALELAQGQADSLWKQVKSFTPPPGEAYARVDERELTNTKLTPLGRPVTFVDFLSANRKLPTGLGPLYLQTGDPRYAEMFEMCIDQRFIDRVLTMKPKDNGSGKSDPLAGRHASGTMDFLFIVHVFGQATHNKRYTDAAEAGWDIIAARHVFETGGVGSKELFVTGAQSWQLPETLNAQETCATAHWTMYNYVLLQASGESKYADQIEGSLYNGLLAAQDPEAGAVTYFLNLTGEDKPFDHPPQYGRHCCEGNHQFVMGCMPGMIYGTQGNSISVNLYIPSEVQIQLPSGNPVTLTQETNYPADGNVLLRVDAARGERFAINLRIPEWCVENPHIEVNDAAVTPIAAPGQWQAIEREWSRGDLIRVKFAMGPYPLQDVLGPISRVALRWGPLVLAGTWTDDLALAQDPPEPTCGVRSSVNRVPYLPLLRIPSGELTGAWRRVSNEGPEFEAEGITPMVAAPSGEGQNNSPRAARLKIRFVPFHTVSRGKYSIWFPATREI